MDSTLKFDTKELADAFIAVVNAGEGIPAFPNSVSTTYAYPVEVFDEDGNTTHWEVVEDEVTRRYFYNYIYTETPFEPWTSSFGETSPVEPRSEGWVFPANVGWEEELTTRGMTWEYIEVTKDSEGAWASVKSTVGGYWETIKNLFN
jgi:hypothetical protein